MKQINPNDTGHWWFWNNIKKEWRVALIEHSQDGHLFSFDPYFIDMKNKVWGGKANYPKKNPKI